jgi:hypothetical protein
MEAPATTFAMLSALPEFRWERSPTLATFEVLPGLITVPADEVTIPSVSLAEKPVGRDNRTMRPIPQKLLDLPEILFG